MRGVLLILGLVLVLADVRGEEVVRAKDTQSDEKARAAEDAWWLGTFRGRVLVVDRDYERVVELTVAKPKDGGAVRVTGGYWFTDGLALAPDFEGELISSDKVRAKFSFLDSFANEGTLTLTREGRGAVLSIKIAVVKNSRVVSMYERVALRRF
jgi:hypothetical protein